MKDILNKSEEGVLRMTTSEARLMGEVLCGYIDGQLKKYRRKYYNDVYDLNNAQLAARIMDVSNPRYLKLARVISGYISLVSSFNLEDSLNLSEL